MVPVFPVIRKATSQLSLWIIARFTLPLVLHKFPDARAVPNASLDPLGCHSVVTVSFYCAKAKPRSHKIHLKLSIDGF